MSALKPDAVNKHDLGTSSLPWKELHVDQITMGARAGDTTLTLGSAALLTADAPTNLVIHGSLTVNGATTTVSSNELVIKDKTITLASTAENSGQANGAGITVAGASATLLYDDTGTQWEFNKPVEVAGNLLPEHDGQGAFDLGSLTQNWNDLHLSSGGVINFNVNDASDVSLTHSAGALTLSGSDKLQFRDATEFLHSDTDGSMTLEGGSAVKLSIASNRVLLVDSDSVDIAQQLNVDAVTASTSTSTGALVVDGGLGLAGDAHFGGDLSLQHDEAVLHFGGDDDVSLTHVHDTGLLLNGGMALRFRDAALEVKSSADGQLDLLADGELALTAPVVDIDASTAVRISNDLELDSDAAVLKFGGDGDVSLTHVHDTGLLLNAAMQLQFRDADLKIHSSGDSKLDIDSNGEIEINAATDIDIDAADVQIDATATFSIQGADDSDITVAAATKDLSIVVSGGGAQVLSLASAGTGADAIDITASAGGIDIDANGALALDGAGGINIGQEANVAINVDSSTFDLDASGAITIDGTSTIGIGTAAATTGISIGTNATQRTIQVGTQTGNTTVDIDAGTGGVIVDTTGAVSLDAALASNFTTSSGALTLHGAGGINIGTAADVNVDFNAAELDIDSKDTTSLTMTANDANNKVLTVAASNSGDGEGQLSLSSDSQVTVSDGTATLLLDGGATTLSGASTLDVDTSGLVTIDSSGGDIRLGAEDHDNDISIGTDGVRTITLGTSSGTGTDPTTKVDMNAATIEADANTQIILDSAGTGATAIDINSAGGLDVDVADVLSLTTTSGGGHIELVSAHTAGQAILIDADANAGSILDIDAGILTIDTQGAQTLTSGGTFDVNSTGAVTIDSDAGLTLGGSSVDVDADGGVLSLDGSNGINIGTAADVAVDLNAAALDIDSKDTTSLTMTASDDNEKVLTIDAINSGAGAAKIVVGSTAATNVNIGGGSSTVAIGNDLTVAGNLTVSGTQTVVNTVTMEAANAIVFEGATANDFETTLTIIDPDADRTIQLPNQSGCLPVLELASDVQITATPAELNYVDVTPGTATASKALVLDGDKNIETIGTVGCGAITSTGASSFGSMTTSGRIEVNDATEATNTTNGSLQTDGGLSVVKDAVLGHDLKLVDDGAVISLGAGADATLTHDNTTGLVIAATPISIDSTGELHLSSTTGDVKLQDGGVDQILFDLDGDDGQVSLKPMVDGDKLVLKQFDGTEVLSINDDASLSIAGGAGSDGVTVTSLGQITADGRVIVSKDTEATSTSDGALQTEGGLSVVKSAVIGADLSLLSDQAILNFGANEDVKLTHVHNTGLLLNDGMQLQFRDSGLKIHASGNGQLDIDSDGEIEIDASTIVDINAGSSLTMNSADDSNLTMAANNENDKTITIAASNTGAGDGLIDIDASGAITVDSTGAGISLDAATASNFTTASGALTLDGDDGVNIVGNAAEIDITTSGALDLNAGATTLDASTLNVTLSSTATLSSTELDIDSTDTTSLTMTANAASVKTLTIDASNSNGGGEGRLSLSADDQVDITDGTLTLTLDGGAATLSGVSTLDIDTSGAITVDSTGSGISLDAAAASNFTTSGGALTLAGAAGVTVTSTGGELHLNGTGRTVNIDSAALDIDASGAITIDGTSTLALSADDTTSLSMAANDNDEKVLTIDAANAGAGAAKIALGTTAQTAISIGNAQSETTVNDNLTITGLTTASGNFSVGGAFAGAPFKVFSSSGNTVIGGTLTVTDALTSNGSNLKIKDSLIVLSSSEDANDNGFDVGFVGGLASDDYVGFIYDNSDSRFVLKTGLAEPDDWTGSTGSVNTVDYSGSANATLELGQIYLNDYEQLAANQSDGTVSTSKHATLVTTGADASIDHVDLGAGTEGQVKVIIMEADGTDNLRVDVAAAGWAGGAGTITLTDRGHACTLQYINSSWWCIGNNGCTFA